MGKQTSDELERRLEKGARRRRACLNHVDDDSVLIFVDGHDDAILGVAMRDGEFLVVYDEAEIIRTLRKRDGMDKEGAAEFFEYNIVGCSNGAETPIFLKSA